MIEVEAKPLEVSAPETGDSHGDIDVNLGEDNGDVRHEGSEGLNGPVSPGLQLADVSCILNSNAKLKFESKGAEEQAEVLSQNVYGRVSSGGTGSANASAG